MDVAHDNNNQLTFAAKIPLPTTTTTDAKETVTLNLHGKTHTFYDFFLGKRCRFSMIEFFKLATELKRKRAKT